MVKGNKAAKRAAAAAAAAIRKEAQIKAVTAVAAASSKEAEIKPATPATTSDEVAIKIERCKQELLTKMLEENVTRDEIRARLENYVSKPELEELLKPATPAMTSDEVAIKIERCKLELLTKMLEENVSRDEIQRRLENYVSKPELEELLKEKCMRREELEDKVKEMLANNNSIKHTIASEGIKAVVHEDMPGTMEKMFKGFKVAGPAVLKAIKDLLPKED